MPPKFRTARERRATMDRERKRVPAEERALRVPKSEAYQRNLRAADKAALRKGAWEQWD